jgi:hypothetical protein
MDRAVIGAAILPRIERDDPLQILRDPIADET